MISHHSITRPRKYSRRSRRGNLYWLLKKCCKLNTLCDDLKSPCSLYSVVQKYSATHADNYSCCYKNPNLRIKKNHNTTDNGQRLLQDKQKNGDQPYHVAKKCNQRTYLYLYTQKILWTARCIFLQD